MSDAYSFSLTTFSPSGKLVQIEYALNAVAQGRPALGIKAKNGVVLATEAKMPSVLMEQSTLKKIQVVDEHLGITYAGMSPDFQVIVKQARKKALAYNAQYGTKAPVSQVAREIAGILQDATQSGGVRPYGCSLMLAGFDDEGPQLFQIDPSGAYFKWKASALGKNYVNSKTFLEKRYNEELDLDDAVHTALLTLKEGFEGAMDENNIQVATCTKEHGFKLLSPSDIKDYLQEVE